MIADGPEQMLRAIVYSVYCLFGKMCFEHDPLSLSKSGKYGIFFDVICHFGTDVCGWFNTWSFELFESA